MKFTLSLFTLKYLYYNKLICKHLDSFFLIQMNIMCFAIKNLLAKQHKSKSQLNEETFRTIVIFMIQARTTF